MGDPIIKELWKIKDAIAEENGYAIDTLIDALETGEVHKGRDSVDISDKEKRKRPLIKDLDCP